ncbi:MAG: 30S ribosomal protein S12 methylthiotransferase RimO [Deltaproteobacteria bacterium]|nr:30S ribosomal protein S12 methylthiotransferase RimO [Deltaproteobacteria bacterium]NIS77519.1 30S ribosomal protein S12 methylthiotransferase RimO [Deltaproteobacteria bacterium]
MSVLVKDRVFRVGLVHLGCAKNMVDTEVMETVLARRGVSLRKRGFLDAVIINTCGFIDAAKEESLGEIFRFVELKRKGKVGKILVGGCLSQRYMVELEMEIPEIDKCFKITDVGRIDEILMDVMGVGRGGMGIEEKTDLEDLYIERIRGKGRAWRYLKITDGCSNHCSYCTIPDIRGPLASRETKRIVSEFRAMIQKGVSEVNLVGQDIGSFGKDGARGFILENLLEELSCHASGDIWLRLLYLHPARITEKLVKIIRESPLVLNYLDIPIQHGSTRILERMNRGYTREYLYELFAMLRTNLDDLVLRTTVMVGFPGEGLNDFELLLRLIEDVGFERLGGFTYSREEGTPAWGMVPKVKKNVAISRLEELITVQSRISFEKNKRYLGKKAKVLVDAVSRREATLTGRYYGQAPEVDGFVTAEYTRPVKEGEFVTVKIDSCDHYDLSGTVINEKEIDF